MNKSLVVLAIIFTFSIASHAQTPAPSPSPSSALSQANATPQSPELEEANRLNAQVISLYNAGSYDEALPLARRALAIRERILSPDNQLIASSLVNLAEIHRAKGQYDDAERFFERSLSIYERTLGANDANVARLLNSLAFVYFARRNYGQAERAFRRVLAIRENNLGPEHLDVAQSLYNLAEFFETGGDYDEAQPLLRRALTIRVNRLGRSHPDVSLTVAKYGCVLRKANRESEAETLERDFSSDSERNAAGVRPTPAEDAGMETGLAQSVRAGVITGRAISRVEPAYPLEAREQRVTGQVTVRIIVNENGRVIHACAVSGHRLLLRASEQSAYRWRFTPTQMEGRPVRTTGSISFNFSLP